MIKAVIFDIDQTLIDFMKMKTLSCEAAMDAMIAAGLKTSKRRGMKILFDLYGQYGIEYQRIFQVFMKRVHGKIDYGIMASGIVAYRRVKEGLLCSYPDALRVLKRLKKRYKLIVLSDAPRMQAWTRLAAMNMHDIFDMVLTFDDTKVEKPDKKGFLRILRKMRLKPQECAMVGDSMLKDMAAAKDLGMMTIWAKYGGNFYPTRVKPDYTINRISDLLKIL